MECIRCNIRMNKEIKHGVLIDSCPICDGVWLDHGELDMLKKGEKKINSELLKDLYQEVEIESQASRSKTGLCPKCDSNNFALKLVHGVEIDYCSDCKGAFFDWGEIEEIIAAEQAE